MPVYQRGTSTFNGIEYGIFVDNETPTQVDETTFTLAHTPSPLASLHFIIEGGELIYGSSESNGYSLSGYTIITISSYPMGIQSRVNYRY